MNKHTSAGLAVADVPRPSSNTNNTNCNTSSEHNTNGGNASSSRYKDTSSSLNRHSSHTSSSTTHSSSQSRRSNTITSQNSNSNSGRSGGGSSSRSSNNRSMRRSRSKSRERSRSHSRHRERNRSTSSPRHPSSQTQRHRERTNILGMQRTAVSNNGSLSPRGHASQVLGVDVAMFENTNELSFGGISEKLGIPGVCPTHMNRPEEKFRLHALRNVAYVNPLPRGFCNEWDQQYSYFANKKVPVLDELPRAFKIIQQIQKRERRRKDNSDTTNTIEKSSTEKLESEKISGSATSSMSGPATTTNPEDNKFTSYLIRNVRRLDTRIAHEWMNELANGQRTIEELVTSLGVPFQQWIPVANNPAGKYPLLDYIARYTPPFDEATWFIRLNVIYVEMNDINRDMKVRSGDWFHNPRRVRRRSQGWTDQLMDYLHTISRQAPPPQLGGNNLSEVGVMREMKAFDVTARKAGKKRSDVNSSSTIAANTNVMLTTTGGDTIQNLPFYIKWSYVLRLSEYQFKLGLLDCTRYLDGLLSLLQKALCHNSSKDPIGTSFSSNLLSMGMNECMSLISVIHNLLKEFLLSSERSILLVKLVIQILRHLVPPQPGSNCMDIEFGHPLQEELVVAFCQILRDILKYGWDVLVRAKDISPATWPIYVISSRFFDHAIITPEQIMENLTICRKRRAEVTGRYHRLMQYYPSTFNIALMDEAYVTSYLERIERELSSSKSTIPITPSIRSQSQVLQCLDFFHRIDAANDLRQVYHGIFLPLHTSDMHTYHERCEEIDGSCKDLPVDIVAITWICEWAVTSQRPAEYRYLTALSLLEMHSAVISQYAEKIGWFSQCKMADRKEYNHSEDLVVLQRPLQLFLQHAELKTVAELNQVIDLFCILIRRKLFCINRFVEFVGFYDNYKQADGHTRGGATLVQTSYNIECGPGRGYKSSDINLLSVSDRFKLFLWQFPRGATATPCIKYDSTELKSRVANTQTSTEDLDAIDQEVRLIRWLQVTDSRVEQLLHSKTFERAQSLCINIFHSHNDANENPDLNASSNSLLLDRVQMEIDYSSKVGELIAAVKIMCGHDKCRFSMWFRDQFYKEDSIFRFSEFGSVEQIVRLAGLVLEIVDILELLQVLLQFVRSSPVYLVKTAVISLIDRHELAFCATGQIPLLLQTFVDRFNNLKELADDKTGAIAKFFCRVYYTHTKKTGDLDLPMALLRPIMDTARKNKEAENNRKKLEIEAGMGKSANGLSDPTLGAANGTIPPELALDAQTPIARIPQPHENLPLDLSRALNKSFRALQASPVTISQKSPSPKSGNESNASVPSPGNSSTISQGVPSLQNSQSQGFELPNYNSFIWKDAVFEATSDGDTKCRDAGIEFATSTINAAMVVSVGATNPNATRERRAPSYVFFLRAVLTELMDKWITNIDKRVNTSPRRPIVSPYYLHRCVRLIREVVEQHPEGAEFADKFSKTLGVWLQKEVIPNFSSDAQKPTKNRFVASNTRTGSSAEHGKESFLLNQKGRLDRLQYGLKSFLVSLLVHKVMDLHSLLRYVLVPLFPRIPDPNRPATKDTRYPVGYRLLALNLTLHLFSEPPQNVLVGNQKYMLFDEPMTKYHIRYLRSQVHPTLWFQLVDRLNQLSYQMEGPPSGKVLRKRDEVTTLASIALFSLTADSIVRDSIFRDSREAREKYIMPSCRVRPWETAVMLTHMFRHPTAAAEVSSCQVHILKVHEILEKLNIWVLHRVGSIYLDLQMSRQQQKGRGNSNNSNKRKRQTRNAYRGQIKDDEPQDGLIFSNKRRKVTDSSHHVAFANQTYVSCSGSRINNYSERAHGSTMHADGRSILDDIFNLPDDDSREYEFEDDTNDEKDSQLSGTDILSSIIVNRTINQHSRPKTASLNVTIGSPKPYMSTAHIATPIVSNNANSATPLVTASTIATPASIATPGISSAQVVTPIMQTPNSSIPRPTVNKTQNIATSTAQSQYSTSSKTSLWSIQYCQEAKEATLISFYAAVVCSTSKRVSITVIGKLLQVLEDDVNYTNSNTFNRSINDKSIVTLFCQIMASPPGNASIHRYVMSLAIQLEWIYEACTKAEGSSRQYDEAFQQRLRRKLAIRLQLLAIICHSKHIVKRTRYRDRIVKTLLSLLGTAVVSSDVGISLFTWMLDIIPLLNSSILQDQHADLVSQLSIPDSMKRRIWSVFSYPRAGSYSISTRGSGITGVKVTNVKDECVEDVDPWALLEHLPQLPSDTLVSQSQPSSLAPKRRRVFHCV